MLSNPAGLCIYRNMTNETSHEQNSLTQAHD